MVSLSSGAERAIQEQIELLGTDIVTVSPGNRYRFGTSEPAMSLTVSDAEAISTDAESTVAVVPQQSSRQAIQFNGENHSAKTIGTTPNFAEIYGFKLIDGRIFTPAENAMKKRVVVIGSEVPGQIGHSSESLLGETIYLQDIGFEVVGVLDTIGSVGWENMDDRVWIPLLTSQFRVKGSNELDLIKVKIESETSLALGMFDIERVMRREHRIPPGKSNDFTIGNPAQYLSIRNQTNNVFGYLLAGIASVSLIVGGIGIMNIMLVSVSERRGEIGLRKALGATNNHVLLQFLIEAMVLCLLGGVIGILLGAGAAQLMSQFFDWEVFVSASAVGIAFSFSVTVGLVFGIWPARTAAQLNPVDTLRIE